MRALGARPDIYDQLVRSIAPSIWKMDDVKRGLLAQLFGGSSKVRLAAPPSAGPPAAHPPPLTHRDNSGD